MSHRHSTHLHWNATALCTVTPHIHTGMPCPPGVLIIPECCLSSEQQWCHLLAQLLCTCVDVHVCIVDMHIPVCVYVCVCVCVCVCVYVCVCVCVHMIELQLHYVPSSW